MLLAGLYHPLSPNAHFIIAAPIRCFVGLRAVLRGALIKHHLTVTARQYRSRVDTRSRDHFHKAAMASSVVVKEASIRQVIAASIKSALGVPQHPWSVDFVVESVLAELTANIAAVAGLEAALPTPPVNSSVGTEWMQQPSSATSVGGPRSTQQGNRKRSKKSSSRHIKPSKPDTTSRSSSHPAPAAAAAEPAIAASGAAAGGAAVSLAGTHRQLDTIEGSSRSCSGSRNSDNSSSSSKHDGDDSSDAGFGNSSSDCEVPIAPDIAELLDTYIAASDGSGDDAAALAAETADGVEDLQHRFNQLLYDNLHQVDDDDVCGFCSKLLSELAALVHRALQEQQEDGSEAMCGLCGRDMPLTKHHLIPRDVHRELRRRGYGFDQLQAGLMVCRPCHSAIHRAVPDNKELALHYSTQQALSQHEEIAKFAAWARKQRVSSKADVGAKHFRYRR